jgi:hypothetical protein
MNLFLKKWLHESVFYPGCGLDKTDILLADLNTKLYVRADYRVKPEQVISFLKSDLWLNKYNLSEMVELNRYEILPLDHFCDFPLISSREYEKNTHKNKIGDKDGGFFIAKYIINPLYESEHNISSSNKLPDFKYIIFACEDAIDVFNGMYYYNYSNPHTLVLKNNILDKSYRTNLQDRRGRFHASVICNVVCNSATMPYNIISDTPPSENVNSTRKYIWDEYYYPEENSKDIQGNYHYKYAMMVL